VHILGSISQPAFKFCLIRLICFVSLVHITQIRYLSKSNYLFVNFLVISDFLIRIIRWMCDIRLTNMFTCNEFSDWIETGLLITVVPLNGYLSIFEKG